MISKYIDMQPTVYDTLQITITGRLGVLECHTFPTYYDIEINRYATIYDTLEIIMIGRLGVRECNTFLTHYDF
jgi:hypothetical protein